MVCGVWRNEEAGEASSEQANESEGKRALGATRDSHLALLDTCHVSRVTCTVLIGRYRIRLIRVPNVRGRQRGGVAP